MVCSIRGFEGVELELIWRSVEFKHVGLIDASFDDLELVELENDF